ncbi:hypothetical protein RFI_16968 [Reticulomyxa filosa]|uniref:Suppressor of forked domain-containing protein n=1 Tax=Reticulomyxa filosa TaxID=46433 RepID=X6N3B8_RETFI|nr:hypothetical protein RFI_16968 [Reticulomyxa filosa]|eukprot:ETO20249.1 hypothetical protein RFI_16968 [Reticulomyxa filosa]
MYMYAFIFVHLYLYAYVHIPGKTAHRQDRNYQQVQLWERLVEFERSNPQTLEQKELLSRLEFTFRQALMATRNYPDIWSLFFFLFLFLLLYVDFEMNSWNSIERTEKVFEHALQAIPDCVLLHLVYADFLELNKSTEQSSKAKQLLIQNTTKNVQSINPLTFVYYFLFLRRTQGKDATREFFVGCVKLKLYPLYMVAASVEETINNDKDAAYRILTRGWKDFSSVLEYGYAYLKFLLAYPNAKKEEIEHVFEEVLPLVDERESQSSENSLKTVLHAQIYDLFIKFRQRELNLRSIEGSQQLRDEKLRSNRIEKLLHRIDRYSFGHLLPVGESYKLTLLRALQNVSNNTSNETTQIGIRRKSEKMEHIINPDVTQLIAFRPGIRFLTRLDDNDNSKIDTLDSNDEMQRLLNQINCPEAIRELLQLLPAPHQTQLLALPSIPRFFGSECGCIDYFYETKCNPINNQNDHLVSFLLQHLATLFLHFYNILKRSFHFEGIKENNDIIQQIKLIHSISNKCPKKNE